MFSVLAILDPYSTPAGLYNFHKDTSHLLLLHLFKRGHRIFYAVPSNLCLNKKEIECFVTPVEVLVSAPFFSFGESAKVSLKDMNLVLIRKDPPVDKTYLHMTQLLSSFPTQRPFFINPPQALREWNEKLIIFNFPHLIPPTLVTANTQEILSFLKDHRGQVPHDTGGQAVVKPLDEFSGRGVQKLGDSSEKDLMILSSMTHDGHQPVMVQAFLKNVAQGEKRIFIFDGKPAGALLKIPPSGSFMANPDRGAAIKATTLSRREQKTVEEIGIFLKKHKIFFAGIDMIDGFLTEINITSPGLVHEWNEVDQAHHENELVDLIERKLKP